MLLLQRGAKQSFYCLLRNIDLTILLNGCAPGIISAAENPFYYSH